MQRFKTNHDKKKELFTSNGGLQLDQCLMHMLNMLGFMSTEILYTQVCVTNYNSSLCLAACGSY